jgi:prepilin-type N-terminal cleavage/methylation domain-containing protein
MSGQKVYKTCSGFSLVEVLICLVLMGVMAAITIPHFFPAATVGTSPKQTALSQNAALMIVTAYEKYRSTHTSVPTTLRAVDLTPYMNYVRIDSTSTYDHVYGYTSLTCSDEPCLRLHNGGLLSVSDYYHFGGATRNNFVFYMYDPDGVYSGTTNGPGKSIALDLHYDGRVVPSMNRTFTDLTYDLSNNPMAWGPDANPGWFAGF